MLHITIPDFFKTIFYNCIKGEQPMYTEVKETLCDRCAHQEVCIYKQDYLDILKAAENATVTQDTPDGITSKKVMQYDLVSGISVSCKHYSCRWW